MGGLSLFPIELSRALRVGQTDHHGKREVEREITLIVQQEYIEPKDVIILPFFRAYLGAAQSNAFMLPYALEGFTAHDRSTHKNKN